MDTARTTWNAEWESLELRGDYKALAAELEIRVPERQCTRTLAAYARALAFCGRGIEAERILALLQGKSPEGESLVVSLLTQAQLARSRGDWDTAQDLATSALDSASRLANPALLGDAKFALAVAAIELARIFMALDLFQQIRTDAGLSSHRRGLAALNEAWVLWDLGRTDLLSEVQDRVPEALQHRLKLCLALKDFDLGAVSDWISRPHAPEIPAQELFYSAGPLVEAIALSEDDRLKQQGKTSWLADYFHAQQEGESPVTRAWAQRALNLLGLSSEPPSGCTPTWREGLHLHVLDCLILARKDPEGARLFWINRINPLLEKHRLRTPLIPHLGEQGFDPHSKWTEHLGRLLGMDTSPRFAEPKVVIKGTEVIFGDRRLNLGKSPVSVRLMEILAGRKGQKISKEYIHRQLTGNKYLPSKHDSRLHKLIGRLKKKMDDHQIPELWSLPGDNHVLLKHTIEVN